MAERLFAFVEKYLTRKIGVEIKCCLMFFLMLCFYCVFRLAVGSQQAQIMHMLPMVLLAYVIGWIQSLLHIDFDEVDRLAAKEWLFILTVAAVYTAFAYVLAWFDRNILVTAGFGVFMIIAYLCIFWIYKIKRVIDAKLLNNDLKNFQQRTEE